MPKPPPLDIIDDRRKHIRWQYFIHAVRDRQRLDGPYTARKAAIIASVKFNESGVATVILKEPA